MKQKLKTKVINPTFTENDLEQFKKIAEQKGYVNGAEISFNCNGNVKQGIINGGVYFASGDKCMAVGVAGRTVALPLYKDGQWAKVITQPAIKNFITETDLKREMENAIEQKDATIVTLSLELSEIKAKYTKQSQRLGGYVQSNKNYREAILLSSTNKGRLTAQIDILNKKIDGLNDDCALQAREAKQNAHSANEWSKLYKDIQSKWWFKLFNW